MNTSETSKYLKIQPNHWRDNLINILTEYKKITSFKFKSLIYELFIQNKKNLRILVTGGAGFIGGAVIRKLLLETVSIYLI